jgi:hypothetical protein
MFFFNAPASLKVVELLVVSGAELLVVSVAELLVVSVVELLVVRESNHSLRYDLLLAPSSLPPNTYNPTAAHDLQSKTHR